MRFALLAICCVIEVSAQQVPIEGTVVDAETNRPIADAKVILRYAQSPAPLDSLSTPATGAFHFDIREAGSYALEATAAGFEDLVVFADGAGIIVPEAELAPDAEHPARKFNIRLTRTGGLIGYVQDSAAKKPLRLVTVRALRYSWFHAHRRLDEARIAFTDQTGQFRMESLPAGEYILEFQNGSPDETAVAEDQKRYPVVLWPNVSADSASPIIVRAGMESNAGTFSYSKISLAQVKGSISADCDSITDYQVQVKQRAGGALVNRPDLFARCGQGFAMTGVSPGSYRLSFLTRADRGVTQLGSKVIEVGEGADVEVEASVAPAASIAGKMTCGKCDDTSFGGRSRISVQFVPAMQNGLESKIDVEPDGTFAGRVAIDGLARIDALLPPDLYVEQLAYSGSDSGRTVEVRPGSSVTLQFLLGEGPASVTGSISKGEFVVLAQWPARTVDGDSEYVSSEADDSGHFRLTNLAPGTYRVAKIAFAEWSHRDEPGVVEQWLDSGQELTLSEKEARTIAFEAQ